ncbi:lipopolysaccharide-induced tumor necrosis factor-alpha factor homolog [Petromyzon marinus]|uniref:Lipopolysaccharide-induced tumor necrosis factor-alpha factor homolog n=1 Tax=Petromyzon marinus TaxID=7757 RepID=A0AAJ7XHP9_PETMA|nr:lipopolysaccharide-induced tumor necrosis factor-alpha factor homolog [Petromyzon marinus]
MASPNPKSDHQGVYYPMQQPPAYAGQEGSNNPAPMQGATTVYMTQPSATVVQLPPVSTTTTGLVVVQHQPTSFNPVTTTCPSCRQMVQTETSTQPGLLTWLIMGGLCLVGLWLCVWIPLVVDSCKDVEHRCANCKMYITTSRRI